MAEIPEAWWVASQHKQYQEDTFKWLDEQFQAVSRRIDEQGEWQVAQAKEFAQNTAESLSVTLAHTRDSVVIWLGIIAVVALASAGLWFGVGGVALILAWTWWRNLLAARTHWRFDRFRNDRFRKLLEIAEHETMLEEDRNVVLKCRDSILYPFAVAGRESVSPYDIDLIDTLYREYSTGLAHMHIPKEWPPDGYRQAQHEAMLRCDLCATVDRMRKHVEGVISKFESQIEAARTDLVKRVDGHESEAAIHAVAFLTQYREWERGRLPQDPESEALSSLLKSLRDKENWTFDEADQVRESCRIERAQDPAVRSVGLSGGYFASETGKRASKMFDMLTAEMESAANRCGVERTWQFYHTNKNWLCEGSGSPFDIPLEHDLKNIRRAFGRHNPEATVRELTYPERGFTGGLNQLQPLSSYGFDLDLVRRELRAARKLVRKAERERKEERLMFETAKAWPWQAERGLRASRPKDW